MKFLFTIMLVLLTNLANASELIPVRWVFDLGPMGNHSWVIRAVDDGTFKKHGFDVELVGIGPGGYKAGMALYTGKADVGYHDFSAVVLVNSRQESPGIKAIFVVDDASQDHVFFLRSSGIKTLADIDGRRVGAAPTAITKPLFSMISDSKPDYLNLSHSLLVPALVRGEVDAIFGYTTTVNFNLDKVGITDFDSLPLSATLGFPVGRVISASNNWLEKYPGADVALRAAIREALDAHIKMASKSVDHLTNSLTSTADGKQTEIDRAEYNINELILTDSVKQNGISNSDVVEPRLVKYIDTLNEKLDLPHKHNTSEYIKLK